MSLLSEYAIWAVGGRRMGCIGKVEMTKSKRINKNTDKDNRINLTDAVLNQANDNIAQIEIENKIDDSNAIGTQLDTDHVQLDADYYKGDYESELFAFMNQTYDYISNNSHDKKNTHTLLDHAATGDDNPNQNQSFSNPNKVPPYKKYTKSSKAYLLYVFLFQASIQGAKYIADWYNKGYTISDIKQALQEKLQNWRQIKVEPTVFVNIAKVIMFAVASYSNENDSTGMIANYAMKTMFNQQQLLQE